MVHTTGLVTRCKAGKLTVVKQTRNGRNKIVGNVATLMAVNICLRVIRWLRGSADLRAKPVIW